MRPLIIFEMANNHAGNVSHGLAIIDAFAPFINKFKSYFEFAIKFQFRDLGTFIHPEYRNRQDIKYVKRFLETSLTHEEFVVLKNHARHHDFKTICTPFDEKSVSLVWDMRFDILKIASCSFTDWPLLNKIAEFNLPIIASTAGSSLDEIDRVVSFFLHRNKDLSLMHCVGEYPTPQKDLQLNQIKLFKNRYPGLRIGFSSHEDPRSFLSIGLAMCCGATIFERHVAIQTDKYHPNLYSITPNQAETWLNYGLNTLIRCGIEDSRHVSSEREITDLRQFKRGCFATKDITSGETINKNSIFYSWPTVDNQVVANEISKYVGFIALNPIKANQPILHTDVRKEDSRAKIWGIVQKIKEFTTKSNVVLPGRASLEISHHYGIDNFGKTGITMVTVVNRQYCKKLIIMLPGQRNPEHYHKEKDETFFVLYGSVTLNIQTPQGEVSSVILKQGESFQLEPNTKHSFSSVDGCIIEELSSTHRSNDSFYTDVSITNNNNRKTIVNYWL